MQEPMDSMDEAIDACVCGSMQIVPGHWKCKSCLQEEQFLEKFVNKLNGDMAQEFNDSQESEEW
jgi:hypothetical protein